MYFHLSASLVRNMHYIQLHMNLVRKYNENSLNNSNEEYQHRDDFGIFGL